MKSCKESSIAVPPIGAGHLGFPPEIVAQQIAGAVLSFCKNHQRSTLKDILLVDISPPILERISVFIESKLHNKGGGTDFADFQGKFLSTSCERGNTRPCPKTSEKNDKASHQDTNDAGRGQFITNQSDTSYADRLGGDQAAGISNGNSTCHPQAGEKTSGHAPRTRQLLKNANDKAGEGFSSDMKRRGGSAEFHSILVPANDADRDCSICMDTPEKAVGLPCGHIFCEDCIHGWLKQKPTCPCCGKAFGTLKGDQPEGTMEDICRYSVSLPGYEKEKGAIEITYQFPGGIQSENHPNPSRPYKGTTRRAYLPNTPEGREVLELLRRAFKSRLLFTIGRSVTTGKEDQVTWNDVHHKTRIDGGPPRFGYPDPTYLSRVKEELAAKGITSGTGP